MSGKGVNPAAVAALAGIGGVSASALIVAVTMGMMTDMRINASSRISQVTAAATVGNEQVVVDVSDDTGSGETKMADGVDDDGETKDVPVSVHPDKPSDAPSGDGTHDEGVANDASRGDVVVSHDGDVYIIKWGDTLSKISAECGVSVDRLADANGIHNVDLIYADSALVIPRN